ncbi:uncharacterized protein L203_105769 [Cryptococcus depauperatus CBS 7841]|uniref:D-arabinono-1,4-lactone oxidase n=1 Tax=Cryptococcus depauperatus CBS 7841 TaxID=1295531 RepID=A0A1E3I9Q2_9TREE|nr:D-arabinono-1,4-lactone oxidase [Cryptococcus depauperatus CBS 7841]
MMEQDLKAVDTSVLQQTLETISVSPGSPLSTFSNWAKTFQCRPQMVFVPTTALQCRQILELAGREGARVHPVGVGHSPSDLGCTNGWLVRMDGLRGTVQIDHDNLTATFHAGTTLHEVHATLANTEPPLALSNIGSISDQTIGGLISTASHGSGVNFPVISAHVKSLVLALPLPGSPIVRVSNTEDPELFKASLCGLGATGLILEIQMEVEKAFRLIETREAKSINEVLGNLEAIKSSAQHVRVWWYPDGKGAVIGRANRTYEPAQPTSSRIAHFLGFHVTQFFLYVTRLIPSLTPLVGQWAWWLAKADIVVVDDSYKILNVDCLFPQYALEWAIDVEETETCLREIRKWLDREATNANRLYSHFPIEIRWSSADDIWLSPSYGRETCWIGIVTYRPYGLAVPYREFHRKFANLLVAHGGRPHWAKQHVLGPETLKLMYPKFQDFQKVLRRVDPRGILRSENVRRHIDGEKIPERIFKAR